MNNINHWLEAKIIGKLSFISERYGIVYSTGNCKIRKRRCSISFDQNSLFKRSNIKESITIGRIEGRIALWRSLFNMTLIGKLYLKEINCNVSVISGKPLLLDSVVITFKLRRKLRIACMDIGNISCFLQLESKKNCKKLIVDILDFTWNDVYRLFSMNFTSGILQNLYSEDKLHLQVYLKKAEKIDIPFIYADISYDYLSFSNRQKEKSNEINKGYLTRLLNMKLSKQSGSYIVYDNIPKDIVNAIICAEDPSFWNHRGIAPDFLGLAIASNLKERKIIRGASTITMQLMRNLFLSHDRDFLRKIEESILALLLENYYRIDKQTILELYINIIEFAPDIYGLYDAIFFYFGKEYTKLTLIEMITLTYIIPRPKHFYEALIRKSSQLERNLYNHIKNYSHNLLYKGLITTVNYKDMDTEVCFAEEFGKLNFHQFEEIERQKALNISINNLEGIHPFLIKVIKKAIMNTPVPFIITEGVRTLERQKELYAQGRTTWGQIVTNCDGVKNKSNHQLKEDGYGYAVDLYPCICGYVRIHEQYIPEILQIIAEHIKDMAQRLNIFIVWGGDWEMRDFPHFEFHAV